MCQNKFFISFLEFLCVQKKRQEAARAKKQHLEELKREKENAEALVRVPRASPSPKVSTEAFSKLHITPVPNITGDLYPNEALESENKAVLFPSKPVEVPSKPQHLSVAT